jgi:glycosyltransferase involved in cell wall biosynthesis
MPSFQGLFVDSLAAEVDHLFCFLHTREDDNHIDYWISSENVTVVPLGPDAPAYVKTFLPGRFLNEEVRKAAERCDKIIVRGPSALLHNFIRIAEPGRLVYYIVGSFKDGLKHTYSKWYRILAIRLLMRYIDYRQENVLRGSKVIVNSQVNAEKYSGIARNITLVYTTTLRDFDFYLREDTCQSDKIKLIFTGRIDWAKGLRELMEAFSIIHEKYTNIELHFIGWEDDNELPIQKGIEVWAQRKNFSNKVFFHGKKAAGPELLNFYRMGDIYVLPSYYEGFPRTLWEAMASSLPIITTSVGAIPSFLKHKENAYLILPHDQTALADSIGEIIEDKELRMRLIKGGFERVSDITLEIQTKKIINFVFYE